VQVTGETDLFVSLCQDDPRMEWGKDYMAHSDPIGLHICQVDKNNNILLRVGESEISQNDRGLPAPPGKVVGSVSGIKGREGKTDVANQAVYKFHHANSIEVKLTKGKYCVIPSTYKWGATGKFFLSMYGLKGCVAVDGASTIYEEEEDGDEEKEDEDDMFANAGARGGDESMAPTEPPNDVALCAALMAKLPTEKTKEGGQIRLQLFRRFDPNGNGYLSLAEIDKGVRDVLHCDALFNAKPAIIRAYNAAKNCVDTKSKLGADFVERAEFRALLVYLQKYFELYIRFGTIDSDHDRRLDVDEFTHAVRLLRDWNIDVQDPVETFKKVDRDGGGKILFIEFCDWVLKKHLSYDTGKGGGGGKRGGAGTAHKKKNQRGGRGGASSETKSSSSSSSRGARKSGRGTSDARGGKSRRAGGRGGDDDDPFGDAGQGDQDMPDDEEDKFNDWGGGDQDMPEEQGSGGGSNPDMPSVGALVKLVAKLPTGKNKADEKKRKIMFRAFDPNGNGYLSLAEIQKGVRDVLHCDALFDAKPAIMRAYHAAKGAVKSKTKLGDDFVEMREFRALLVYLQRYFELHIKFQSIDSGGDHRIDKGEFKKAVGLLSGWGLNVTNADEEFKRVDKDGGGQILFVEFCEWALNKHLSAEEDARGRNSRRAGGRGGGDDDGDDSDDPFGDAGQGDQDMPDDIDAGAGGGEQRPKTKLEKAIQYEIICEKLMSKARLHKVSHGTMLRAFEKVGDEREQVDEGGGLNKCDFKSILVDLGFSVSDFSDSDFEILAGGDGVISPSEFKEIFASEMEGHAMYTEARSSEQKEDDLAFKPQPTELPGKVHIKVLEARNLALPTGWFSALQQRPGGAAGGGVVAGGGAAAVMAARSGAGGGQPYGAGGDRSSAAGLGLGFGIGGGGSDGLGLGKRSVAQGRGMSGGGGVSAATGRKLINVNPIGRFAKLQVKKRVHGAVSSAPREWIEDYRGPTVSDGNSRPSRFVSFVSEDGVSEAKSNATGTTAAAGAATAGAAEAAEPIHHTDTVGAAVEEQGRSITKQDSKEYEIDAKVEALHPDPETIADPSKRQAASKMRQAAQARAGIFKRMRDDRDPAVLDAARQRQMCGDCGKMMVPDERHAGMAPRGGAPKEPLKARGGGCTGVEQGDCSWGVIFCTECYCKIEKPQQCSRCYDLSQSAAAAAASRRHIHHHKSGMPCESDDEDGKGVGAAGTSADHHTPIQSVEEGQAIGHSPRLGEVDVSSSSASSSASASAASQEETPEQVEAFCEKIVRYWLLEDVSTAITLLNARKAQLVSNMGGSSPSSSSSSSSLTLVQGGGPMSLQSMGEGGGSASHLRASRGVGQRMKGAANKMTLPDRPGASDMDNCVAIYRQCMRLGGLNEPLNSSKRIFNVAEHFKKFDLDNDGFISREEMRHAVVDFAEIYGFEITQREVILLHESFDADGDGMISFDEFTRWLSRSRSSATNVAETVHEPIDQLLSRVFKICKGRGGDADADAPGNQLWQFGSGVGILRHMQHCLGTHGVHLDIPSVHRLVSVFKLSKSEAKHIAAAKNRYTKAWEGAAAGEEKAGADAEAGEGTGEGGYATAAEEFARWLDEAPEEAKDAGVVGLDDARRCVREALTRMGATAPRGKRSGAGGNVDLAKAYKQIPCSRVTGKVTVDNLVDKILTEISGDSATWNLYDPWPAAAMTRQQMRREKSRAVSAAAQDLQGNDAEGGGALLSAESSPRVSAEGLGGADADDIPKPTVMWPSRAMQIRMLLDPILNERLRQSTGGGGGGAASIQPSDVGGSPGGRSVAMSDLTHLVKGNAIGELEKKMRLVLRRHLQHQDGQSFWLVSAYHRPSRRSEPASLEVRAWDPERCQCHTLSLPEDCAGLTLPAQALQEGAAKTLERGARKARLRAGAGRPETKEGEAAGEALLAVDPDLKTLEDLALSTKKFPLPRFTALTLAVDAADTDAVSAASKDGGAASDATAATSKTTKHRHHGHGHHRRHPAPVRFLMSEPTGKLQGAHTGAGSARAARGENRRSVDRERVPFASIERVDDVVGEDGELHEITRAANCNAPLWCKDLCPAEASAMKNLFSRLQLWKDTSHGNVRLVLTESPMLVDTLRSVFSKANFEFFVNVTPVCINFSVLLDEDGDGVEDKGGSAMGGRKRRVLDCIRANRTLHAFLAGTSCTLMVQFQATDGDGLEEMDWQTFLGHLAGLCNPYVGVQLRPLAPEVMHDEVLRNKTFNRCPIDRDAGANPWFDKEFTLEYTPNDDACPAVFNDVTRLEYRKGSSKKKIMKYVILSVRRTKEGKLVPTAYEPSTTTEYRVDVNDEEVARLWGHSALASSECEQISTHAGRTPQLTKVGGPDSFEENDKASRLSFSVAKQPLKQIGEVSSWEGEWERMVAKFTLGDVITPHVRLSAWNANPKGEETFIGELELPLSMITSAGGDVKQGQGWHSLYSNGGTEQVGEVLVAFSFDVTHGEIEGSRKSRRRSNLALEGAGGGETKRSEATSGETKSAERRQPHPDISAVRREAAAEAKAAAAAESRAAAQIAELKAELSAAKEAAAKRSVPVASSSSSSSSSSSASSEASAQQLRSLQAEMEEMQQQGKAQAQALKDRDDEAQRVAQQSLAAAEQQAKSADEQTRAAGEERRRLQAEKDELRSQLANARDEVERVKRANGDTGGAAPSKQQQQQPPVRSEVDRLNEAKLREAADANKALQRQLAVMAAALKDAKAAKVVPSSSSSSGGGSASPSMDTASAARRDRYKSQREEKVGGVAAGAGKSWEPKKRGRAAADANDQARVRDDALKRELGEEGFEEYMVELSTILAKVHASLEAEVKNTGVRPMAVLEESFSASAGGDGVLDGKEFRRCLGSLGIDLSDDDADTMLQHFDFDGDGRIDLDHVSAGERNAECGRDMCVCRGGGSSGTKVVWGIHGVFLLGKFTREMRCIGDARDVMVQ
jgi:Ca2+-binding EF-hand superfamily protein